MKFPIGSNQCKGNVSSSLAHDRGHCKFSVITIAESGTFKNRGRKYNLVVEKNDEKFNRDKSAEMYNLFYV